MNLEGIQEAATYAAQHGVRAGIRLTKANIEAPLRSLFSALEQSPDDLEMALAAAKGMIETEHRMEIPAVYQAWWHVVDLLAETVIRDNPLAFLQKEREIRSVYYITYAAASVSRLRFRPR